MDWVKAGDVKQRINYLIASLDFGHIDPSRIFCFRSFGSKSKARARIWSFPRIWQKALGTSPAYCIEVLSGKFDKLKKEDQDKILIHELLHIPKNFSGSLLPHRNRKGEWLDKKVRELTKSLRK